MSTLITTLVASARSALEALCRALEAADHPPQRSASQVEASTRLSQPWQR